MYVRAYRSPQPVVEVYWYKNLVLRMRAQKRFLQAIQTKPPALLLYLPNATLTVILLISLLRTPRSHLWCRAEG